MMYFDQGNIQCWKDQCEKQRKELIELKTRLADQREERRFQLFKAVLPVIIPMQDDLSMQEVIADAWLWVDESLAELEKKEEV